MAVLADVATVGKRGPKTGNGGKLLTVITIVQQESYSTLYNPENLKVQPIAQFHLMVKISFLVSSILPDKR